VWVDDQALEAGQMLILDAFEDAPSVVIRWTPEPTAEAVFPLTFEKAREYAGKISAGSSFTVAVFGDDYVLTMGSNDYGKDNVDSWTDIVAVSAGGNHTVGLKSDGTLVATGYNGGGQCDAGGWSDILIP